MNQQILFNDDLTFVSDQKLWHWSGSLSGERIEILVKSSVKPESFTTNHQLDWELTIEEYLADNEIENNKLTITID